MNVGQGLPLREPQCCHILRFPFPRRLVLTLGSVLLCLTATTAARPLETARSIRELSPADLKPALTLAQVPVRPIRDLTSDWRSGNLGAFRCRGVVTYHHPGRFLFVADETGAVEIRTDETLAASPGDEVEATGYKEVDDGHIVL